MNNLILYDSKPGTIELPKEEGFVRIEPSAIYGYYGPMVSVLPFERIPPAKLREKFPDPDTYLVALIIESSVMHPRIHDPAFLEPFDVILTFDCATLERFPQKARLFPAGGLWVKPDTDRPKSPGSISMFISSQHISAGHKLRCEILPLCEEFAVDVYGVGVGRYLPDKTDGIAPYQFNIAIENSIVNHYWTEKILDCYACHTVPIYWGCDSVTTFFPAKSMIEWRTQEDLRKILRSIRENAGEVYERHLPSVKEAAEISRVHNYGTYGARIREALA